MRVLGNSTSDPSKIIIEVNQKELEVFKNMCKPQNPVASLDEGWIPIHQQRSFGKAKRISKTPEEKVFTSDEILDSYNAKKISKDELAAMMNEIRRD